MYNGALEELIDAALADGELTEKEKQILFKKAQSMDIDLDEFEMVLDARLHKMSQQQQNQQTAAPKSDKYGDVKKCPSCGAMVQSFRGACPECGYAFEGLKANSSAQILAEKIDEIMKEASTMSSKALSSNSGGGLLGLSRDLIGGQSMALKTEESSQKRIKEVIKNFPIPNTKSDLMEFIITMKLKSESGQFASAYFSKYTECIEKAKYLFHNDKDLAPLVSSYKTKGSLKRWWTSSSKTVKQLIIGAAVWVVLMIIFIILTSL